MLLDCLRDKQIPINFKSEQQKEFLERDVEKWGPFNIKQTQKLLSKRIADEQLSEYFEKDFEQFVHKQRKADDLNSQKSGIFDCQSDSVVYTGSRTKRDYQDMYDIGQLDLEATINN